MSTVAPATAPRTGTASQRIALVAGAVGVSCCASSGWLLNPGHFFRSYLVAYNFWLGIALGCLVILMMQHLTGGAWGMLLRRILEAGARTLLPLAVLFVPLFFGLHWLYAWAKPDVVALDADCTARAAT